MRVEDIAEYQKTRIDIAKIERELEDAFSAFGRSEEIVVDRCHDFGQRGITVTFSFDELNVKSFSQESIQKLLGLIIQHKSLRKVQRQLERKVEIERTKTFAQENTFQQ